MSNIVPEKSLNFRVYINGSDMAGIAEGAFPAVEFMTSEIKGAGISGVIDSPGVGELNSMTMDLTWRTTTKHFVTLCEPGSHILDLYRDDLSFDAGLGKYVHSSVHAYMKAVTKNFEIGKLAVNESAESKTTHEIYVMKLYLNGKAALEIDKYNCIYKVNGTDYLAPMRRALGGL